MNVTKDSVRSQVGTSLRQCIDIETQMRLWASKDRMELEARGVMLQPRVIKSKLNRN
jgi:hypothetical protein